MPDRKAISYAEKIEFRFILCDCTDYYGSTTDRENMLNDGLDISKMIHMCLCVCYFCMEEACPCALAAGWISNISELLHEVNVCNEPVYAQENTAGQQNL